MKIKTPLVFSITAGGTSQEAVPRNTARRYLLLQNTSAGDLWLRYDKAASASSPSIKLEAGDSIHFSAGFAPSSSIHVFGATTGQTFTLWEG